MSADLFEIENLTGGYGDTKVLHGVSASIDQGHILGVFGRNGVGKTTLAKLLNGGLRASSGTIRLSGQDITGLPAFARRGAGIGYMPQTSMVFDDLTVRENLFLGDIRIGPEHFFEVFPRLAERLDQIAGKMSGGERKILSFVRTMIETTNLIILDEPSEGVQPENIEKMSAILQQRKSEGVAIILIEQNIKFLKRATDYMIGLDAGRVVLEGETSTLSVEAIRKVLSV